MHMNIFFRLLNIGEIKFAEIVSISIVVRHTALFRANASHQSELLRERVARKPRTRTGSFVFLRSTRAFGSRFDHIKRQMSFYGGHCHPGTACRESPSPVSYARTFLVANEDVPLPARAFH